MTKKQLKQSLLMWLNFDPNSDATFEQLFYELRKKKSGVDWFDQHASYLAFFLDDIGEQNEEI